MSSIKGREQKQNEEIGLSWSKKAAAEAEAVAAISCSGHGRAFLDGPIFGGQPICECYDCYSGVDCSEFSPAGSCVVDVESGDPIFMEQFWMQNAENSAVVISGWHRMSYWYNDNTMMSTELEKYIRQLHSLVGNANTEGRYLVFGLGAIQLLSAAVYALSSQNSSSPPTVVASAPFYQLFKYQSMLFNSNFEDANSWQLNNSSDDMDVIEFVTSPSNPGGDLKTPVVEGKTIYDHVYFWPQFTPIPAPSDQDVMIFSLSKLTGHAGTRFGWALIKDKDVYDKVSTYIKVADLGISKDSQLRALKLLKVVVEDDGRSFFEFGYNTMRDRWERLTLVFAKSSRFSIQQRNPLHCNFFKETRLPSPAYAWVKCERDEDVDCGAILEAENILGTSGSTFSDDDRYVRLNLMKSHGDFNLLMQRLNELVGHENNASKTGVAQETMQNAVRRGSKAMTELEARQILGVTEKSSWEEIAQAIEGSQGQGMFGDGLSTERYAGGFNWLTLTSF
ncbi:pyridoxal phosphate-dependent transferase [Artemisia annua]|uniref:Pyridoxal phosphate-dependent transferase n=1 Tax=Artemisia annua TaxID=35608 RepID=A0A2U1LDZ4_ARTAN|nr:pyridoxal phosphate-dependent transferase [Artemisia annua]